MRENRTYGLTRGRSGTAASLYSTVTGYAAAFEVFRGTIIVSALTAPDFGRKRGIGV